MMTPWALRSKPPQPTDTEAALREERDRLQAMLDAMPHMLVELDGDRRLVRCRAGWLGPRSPLPEPVRGERFEDALPAPLARLARQVLDEVDEKGRSAGHEYEVPLAEGRRWHSVSASRLPCVTGGSAGYLVVISDTTEAHVQRQQAEQRARTDLAAAMDASHDGIAITDPDGRYLYMNRAHREMFGFTSPEEIIGRSWRDLYAPEVADHLAAVALPALEAEGGWRGEVVGRRLDGSDLPQEVSLTRKAGGGIICMSRNIAKRLREQQEQARLREELQMAQRREIIGQLASGLAHDLNNLLAAIGGSATLIRDLGPGAAEAHAQRILSATEQAGALVRRFLSLGQRQSNRSRIDLRALLHEAADLVRAGLRNRTRLTLALPPEPVWVEADPTDILQVVLNLVINARDAIATAPPREMGYEITLALGAPDPAQLAGPFAAGAPGAGQGYVALTVSDNGPGIAPETQARVFQPYFSTKGAAGTGLGLAIVTGVLAANHGAVALASAPGAGTRFTVLWPIEARDLAEAPAAPTAATAGALTGCLTGRTVLVVDDHADVLRVLSAFLEQAGAEVVPCADPRDALAALRDDPTLWDLLVTDFDMPHLTGADLGQAANELAPDLPVLLISALPDWRSRMTRATPRFASVLGKPLARNDFLTAAEAAMRSAEAADAVG